MASPPSVVADAGEKHWVWCRRVGSVLAAGALLVLVAGRTVAPTRNGMLLTTSDGAVTAAAVTVATGLGQPPGTGAPRKPPLPPPPPTPAPAVFRQGNDMSKPTPEKQTSYDAHAELRKGCVWSPALPAHQLLPPGDVEARSPSIGSHCPADQAARNFFFCTRPNAVHDSMCPGGPAAEFESERVTASKCVAEGVTAGGTPTTTARQRRHDCRPSLSSGFSYTSPVSPSPRLPVSPSPRLPVSQPTRLPRPVPLLRAWRCVKLCGPLLGDRSIHSPHPASPPCLCTRSVHRLLRHSRILCACLQPGDMPGVRP